MWIDVWSTKHRLQIRASDIKVHNQWLDFNSSTSGPSFIARQSYRITQTVVRAVIKVAKLNVLFMAWRLVGSLKPVLQHMHYRISHILPGRTWPLCVVYVCMLCCGLCLYAVCGLCLYAVVWSMFVCCGVVYVCMLWYGLCLYAVVWSMFVYCDMVYVCMLWCSLCLYAVLWSMFVYCAVVCVCILWYGLYLLWCVSSWFHANVHDLKSAETLLLKEGYDGSYLVRRSKTTKGDYSLAVRSVHD